MTNHAAQLAIIKHVTRQESRSSAGNCQAEDPTGITQLRWQLSHLHVQLHHDIISHCPQVKSSKPTSTIFPNSVNGDPVLPFPHVSDTTVLLFSYSLLRSHWQVLQTPPSKCVWSVTLSLHSCCSHFGPDHHHLSSGLFQLPPQL